MKTSTTNEAEQRPSTFGTLHKLHYRAKCLAEWPRAWISLWLYLNSTHLPAQVFPRHGHNSHRAVRLADKKLEALRLTFNAVSLRKKRNRNRICKWVQWTRDTINVNQWSADLRCPKFPLPSNATSYAFLGALATKVTFGVCSPIHADWERGAISKYPYKYFCRVFIFVFFRLQPAWVISYFSKTCWKFQDTNTKAARQTHTLLTKL